MKKHEIHTIFKEATCISVAHAAVIPLYVIPEMVTEPGKGLRAVCPTLSFCKWGN